VIHGGDSEEPDEAGPLVVRFFRELAKK